MWHHFSLMQFTAPTPCKHHNINSSPDHSYCMLFCICVRAHTYVYYPCYRFSLQSYLLPSLPETTSNRGRRRGRVRERQCQFNLNPSWWNANPPNRTEDTLRRSRHPSPMKQDRPSMYGCAWKQDRYHAQLFISTIHFIKSITGGPWGGRGERQGRKKATFKVSPLIYSPKGFFALLLQFSNPFIIPGKKIAEV